LITIILGERCDAEFKSEWNKKTFLKLEPGFHLQMKTESFFLLDAELLLGQIGSLWFSLDVIS